VLKRKKGKLFRNITKEEILYHKSDDRFMAYRITRLSDECSKVDIDRCNWAYRKNESSAFAYQFAFTPYNGAFVSIDRIIVLHAVMQQGTKLRRRERKLSRCCARTRIEKGYRAGNTGGFVVLTQ